MTPSFAPNAITIEHTTISNGKPAWEIKAKFLSTFPATRAYNLLISGPKHIVLRICWLHGKHQQMLHLLAKLRRPEGSPTRTPYSYGREKETHEMIFLWSKSTHEWLQMTRSDYEWPWVTTNEVVSKNISDVIIQRKFKVIVRLTLFHQIMTYPSNLANDNTFCHANYVTFFIFESKETHPRDFLKLSEA